MSAIIQATNVSKSYPQPGQQPHQVLKDINLTVGTGEIIAIMGPSGSGKSTLLHLLSGMESITSGEVIFDERCLSKQNEKNLSSIRLSHMGFVFQHMYLLNKLKVLDNIILPGYLKKSCSLKTLQTKAISLMNRMGIGHLETRMISQVSGGEMQRIAICRSLINDPQLLICDEPTGALNSKLAADVMTILLELNREGITVIIATHDPKIAAKTNRILYMIDGMISDVFQFNQDKCAQMADHGRERQFSNWLIEQGF